MAVEGVAVLVWLVPDVEGVTVLGWLEPVAEGVTVLVWPTEADLAELPVVVD